LAWSFTALNFDSVREDARVALNGLYELLKVLKASADFFGPLKATVSGLLFCIDTYKVCGLTELMMHAYINPLSENVCESRRDGWVDK